MAATLKLLPTEHIPGEAARGWNLTDLLRRVAAEHEHSSDAAPAPGPASIEVTAAESAGPASVAASPCLRLRMAAVNGATASGQMMPASSCEASMMAATSRLGPMP